MTSEPVLWPPPPPVVAGKSFHQTLTEMRAILELHLLKHETTVYNYAKQFEEILPYALISKSRAINLFILGLQPDIRKVVQDFNPNSLDIAISRAYLHEMYGKKVNQESTNAKVDVLKGDQIFSCPNDSCQNDVTAGDHTQNNEFVAEAMATLKDYDKCEDEDMTNLEGHKIDSQEDEIHTEEYGRLEQTESKILNSADLERIEGENEAISNLTVDIAKETYETANLSSMPMAPIKPSKSKRSMYPEVIAVKPEPPLPNPNPNSSSPSSSSNLYPSLDPRDFAHNLIPYDFTPSAPSAPLLPHEDELSSLPSVHDDEVLSASEDVLLKIPGAVLNFINQQYNVTLATSQAMVTFEALEAEEKCSSLLATKSSLEGNLALINHQLARHPKIHAKFFRNGILVWHRWKLRPIDIEGTTKVHWKKLQLDSQLVDKVKDFVAEKIADVKNPEADDVDFKGVSKDCVEYLASVSFSNPYSSSIPICEISHSVKSAGREIAKSDTQMLISEKPDFFFFPLT